MNLGPSTFGLLCNSDNLTYTQASFDATFTTLGPDFEVYTNKTVGSVCSNFVEVGDQNLLGVCSKEISEGMETYYNYTMVRVDRPNRAVSTSEVSLQIANFTFIGKPELRVTEDDSKTANSVLLYDEVSQAYTGDVKSLIAFEIGFSKVPVLEDAPEAGQEWAYTVVPLDIGAGLNIKTMRFAKVIRSLYAYKDLFFFQFNSPPSQMVTDSMQDPEPISNNIYCKLTRVIKPGVYELSSECHNMPFEWTGDDYRFAILKNPKTLTTGLKDDPKDSYTGICLFSHGVWTSTFNIDSSGPPKISDGDLHQTFTP